MSISAVPFSMTVQEWGHTHQRFSFSLSTFPPPSTSPSPSPFPSPAPSDRSPFHFPAAAAAPVPAGAFCCHLHCHLFWCLSWRESRRRGWRWWGGLRSGGRSCRDGGGDGDGTGAGCGVCERVCRGRSSSGGEWTVEMDWRGWSDGSLFRLWLELEKCGGYWVGLGGYRGNISGLEVLVELDDGFGYVNNDWKLFTFNGLDNPNSSVIWNKYYFMVSCPNLVKPTPSAMVRYLYP